MTTTSGTITQPIPDTTFYRPMRAGHYVRHGHELAGYLASDDGAIWRLVAECCQVHPVPVDIAPEARTYRVFTLAPADPAPPGELVSDHVDIWQYRS